MNTKATSSLAERVQASFSKLASSASELNSVSDNLGKSIASIDQALKQLNLGLTVWVEVSHSDYEDLTYAYLELGYAKIEGTWGIALRRGAGDHNSPEEDRIVESWLFSDGPRASRLVALEHIPTLLQRLSEESVKTTDKIKARLEEVQEVAKVVQEASAARKAGAKK